MNSNPLSNAYGIAYGHDVWVAVGQGSNPFIVSRDGSNWMSTISFPPFVNTAFDVAYDGTKFLAVVSTTSIANPNIVYSVNGSNWLSYNTTGTSPTWRYMYGNGQVWFATGTNGASLYGRRIYMEYSDTIYR